MDENALEFPASGPLQEKDGTTHSCYHRLYTWIGAGDGGGVRAGRMAGCWMRSGFK